MQFSFLQRYLDDTFMTKFRFALAAVAVAVLPAVAFAQFNKPEAAVHYRQSVMTVMSYHFGQLAAVVKGQKPFDANEVATNAALVQTLSHLPWMAFGPGTDKAGKTEAKAEIWSQPDKFKQAHDTMEKAADALAVAAKSGDQAQFKTAFGDVGKACKGCHDEFKEK